MPKSNINCDFCNKFFYKKPSHIAASKNSYCSKACYTESSKLGKVVPCYLCAKKVYKKRHHLQKFERNFCSKECSITWQNTEFVGDKHPNWTTGKASYRFRLKQKRPPQQCRSCNLDDTRMLIVHHIDHDRDNNEFSNLVWMCKNCHHLIHNYPKEHEKFLLKLNKKDENRM